MPDSKPLKICQVSAELAPFAKTGGLADVTAALSAYLHDAGHEVLVLMPHYPRVGKTAGPIEPVQGLQDLSLRVGPHQFRYSIDRTTLPRRSLPVHLLRCPALFGREGIYTADGDEHLRFVALTRAAIELCQHLGFAPDIFHCHDWHTALGPLYLKTVYAWDRLFRNTRSVLTIHNIGYQGVFAADKVGDLGLQGVEQHLHQEDLARGRVNFMKTGILYADLITAVSPTYAREIQRPEFGLGLEDLLRERRQTVVGILNGVDYGEWNPATDELLPANYSPRKMKGKAQCKQQLMEELGLEPGSTIPLVGIVSRLVSQKGIDLIEAVVPRLLARREFAMAILGSGERRYEHFFSTLQNRFRDRVCYYRGYNEKLAHWIEAGADMFLMPSQYEPCGLNQMYSLKYGTVPIVRETGGLADSVEMVNPDRETGNGIVFRDYDSGGLNWALNLALDLYTDRRLWKKIVANGMRADRKS
ncbi:MAG: glycogen synthase, partial [Xanthomonadales bacterium]|nr:glycogen synthase [Xanthomonadales bacterium]